MNDGYSSRIPEAGPVMCRIDEAMRARNVEPTNARPTAEKVTVFHGASLVDMSRTALQSGLVILGHEI